MARGSVLWRCGQCRRTWKTKPEECPHKGAGYYLVFRHLGVQKWEAAGPNKKDAEKRLFEVLSQINNGTFRKDSGILFKDFVKLWLRDYAKGRTKESTYRSYESMIDHRIIPELGEIPLAKITPGTVQSFISGISNGKKRKTANNFLALLKTIFKHAEIWEYCRSNPTRFLKKERADTKEMDHLTPQEVRLLLKHSEAPYKALFLTAIMTGMRRGELLGLQWGDIDWNRNLISVKRGLFWLSESERSEGEKERWKFISLKSEKSRRSIVMSPALSKALQIHRINCSVSPYDLVFCNKDGNPMDPDNMVKREFFPALVRAELRKVRFHDLRHTFASLLLAQNENIKFIQNQLGHASIQTTIDRYSHLMPNYYVGVGTRLDKQVFKTKRSRKEKVLAPR